MSFRPLRHGERFTYIGFGLTPPAFRGRNRVDGVPVDPGRAVHERWTYGSVLCLPEEEGVTWARGWKTKASAALLVAHALGAAT